MRFPRQYGWTLVAASLGLAFGCQEFGAGPCIHTYRDPVLAITAATNAATGARIAQLFITGVTVGGQVQPVSYLLATAFGARAQGDTIICDVPCGFGTSEGAYGFTASAPGYVARAITVNARFARFDGGCPSFNAGSTETSVPLARDQ